MPLLLLLLCQSFLLYLMWPNTRKMSSRGCSEPFWNLDLLLLFQLLHQLLSSTKALMRVFWKPSSWTYIRVKPTQSAITSSSSVRTILLSARPKIKIGCHLPPLFLKIQPCFASSNTSVRWKMRLTSLSPGRNWKPFFAKAWVSSSFCRHHLKHYLKAFPVLARRSHGLGSSTRALKDCSPRI